MLANSLYIETSVSCNIIHFLNMNSEGSPLIIKTLGVCYPPFLSNDKNEQVIVFDMFINKNLH